MVRKSNEIWDRKYQPRNMDEYIAAPEIKARLNKIIEELPNTILFGPPGIGKGAFMEILTIFSATKPEFIKVNASDETGVDAMRDRVKLFATAMGITPIKIVWLNEADRLTSPAQEMLLQLIEDTHKITRFIFVGNDISRMIEPLRSRCREIEITNPPIAEIEQRCRWILKAEGVHIEKAALQGIINQFYPDIRKIINFLKESVEDGKLIAYNPTCKQESQQQQPQTKYPGVYKRGKKWAAQIRIGKEVKHIGTYNTPEEAHQAYLEVK